MTYAREATLCSALPQLVKLLENLEVHSQLATQGYHVDWKAFNELIKELTGQDIFVTGQKIEST